MRHVGRVWVAAVRCMRLSSRLRDLRLRLDADEDALVKGAAMMHVLKTQGVGLHEAMPL